MNPRDRVLAALRHEQPDKIPWALECTQPALAKLADHYGVPRLTDVAFFDNWVGNHFRVIEPVGNGLFHGLEEEVEPGLWRDGWGVIWDTRGLYGEGEWAGPGQTKQSAGQHPQVFAWIRIRQTETISHEFPHRHRV